MKRPVFAANWKMHHGPSEATAFMRTFLSHYKRRSDRTVVIFPPAPTLHAVVAELASRPDIVVGVQNIHWEDKGAFTGEISAGWINERFDDARLKPISGPALAANLAWSPQRGTTVNLNAETIVEGTTTAGDSGSIYYSGTLSASREIRANLTLDAAIGAALRDYSSTSDRDLTLRGESSLTWWVNRAVGLVGRYRVENVSSTLPGRDTTTNQIYLGMKLQR